MKDMTSTERHSAFANTEKEDFEGDTADELAENGLVTQEQADSINAYAAQ